MDSTMRPVVAAACAGALTSSSCTPALCAATGGGEGRAVLVPVRSAGAEAKRETRSKILLGWSCGTIWQREEEGRGKGRGAIEWGWSVCESVGETVSTSKARAGQAGRTHMARAADGGEVKRCGVRPQVARLGIHGRRVLDHVAAELRREAGVGHGVGVVVPGLPRLFDGVAEGRRPRIIVRVRHAAGGRACARVREMCVCVGGGGEGGEEMGVG